MRLWGSSKSFWGFDLAVINLRDLCGARFPVIIVAMRVIQRFENIRDKIRPESYRRRVMACRLSKPRKMLPAFDGSLRKSC